MSFIRKIGDVLSGKDKDKKASPTTPTPTNADEQSNPTNPIRIVVLGDDATTKTTISQLSGKSDEDDARKGMTKLNQENVRLYRHYSEAYRVDRQAPWHAPDGAIFLIDASNPTSLKSLQSYQREIDLFGKSDQLTQITVMVINAQQASRSLRDELNEIVDTGKAKRVDINKDDKKAIQEGLASLVKEIQVVREKLADDSTPKYR